MKKITTSIAILLLLAGTFFSCNKEEPDIPFDEPIDVPFTVFSRTGWDFPDKELTDPLLLPGTSCRWVRCNRNEVIIINSDRELRRHITCAENSDLPAIDFSKYTLLLARGIAVATPYTVHMGSLQQHSSRSYVMNVQVRVTGVETIGFWHVAILTGKLNENANIKLNVVFPQWEN